MDWSKPRIAIVGSGAIGGYYGALLARRGHDVHFLLRSDYCAVKEHGWTILSPRGDFVLLPQDLYVYDDVRKMPAADLVIVAIKATDNAGLLELVPPLLHPQTALLTLQNGLGNEEFLAEHFGAHRVLGGMAFICSNRQGPGVIRHIDQGFITLGEFVPSYAGRLEAITAVFTESGIDCRALGDLRHGRWEKLVWNIPFNGLGAALDLTTDRLLASAAGERIVRDVMGEVVAIASSLGLSYRPDLIDQKIAVTRQMGAYRTSMQIDRQSGRPLEIEAIIGRPLAVAGSCGVAVLRLAQLHELLCTVAGQEPPGAR